MTSSNPLLSADLVRLHQLQDLTQMLIKKSPFSEKAFVSPKIKSLARWIDNHVDRWTGWQVDRLTGGQVGWWGKCNIICQLYMIGGGPKCTVCKLRWKVVRASALPVKTLEFCELLLSNLLACSAVHLVQQAKWKVNTICSGFCLKIGKLDFHPQSQNILNFLTEICSPSDRTPLLDGHKKVDSWEIELRLLVLLYSSIPLCYFAGMPAWSILWIDWMLDTVSLS